MNHPWAISNPEFQADTVCPMNPVWPWGGHRNFAYDLVRWMQPRRIVELGVHWGTSFFTFAQAIKDARLSTELIGVDTFKGDEHAGEYGEEVLGAVRTVIDRYFRDAAITLHRMFFTEALPLVPDESVDLLHIDGLHTHEAVRFDFEHWMPKLAPQGVMLFHDTAPTTGYGSAEFWKDISSRHPGFAFEHSWGLGVLFPKGDARLMALRNEGLDDKVLLYAYKAEGALAGIQIRDLTRIADERLATIQSQARLIDQRSARVESLTSEVEARREVLADLRRGLAAAESLAADREQLARRLDAAATLAQQRYESLQEHTRMLAARDERITKLAHDLEAARDRARALAEHLNKLEAIADKRRERIDALDAQLKEQKAVNNEISQKLRQIETDLELLHVRSDHVEETLATHRAQIAALMGTRPGRKAAARLAAGMPPHSVVVSNGLPKP